MTHRPECTSETTALSHVIARLSNIALQDNPSIEKLGDLFANAKCAPRGPVVGQDRLKHCRSLRNEAEMRANRSPQAWFLALLTLLGA
jgi:hypothetical protein